MRDAGGGGTIRAEADAAGGWSASHQGSHAEAAALSRSRTCTTGIACRAGRSRTREEEEGRRGSRAVPRAREQALDVAGKLGERFEQRRRLPRHEVAAGYVVLLQVDEHQRRTTGGRGGAGRRT